MSAKYIIKILTLGDTTVGKSSIVLRFSDDVFDDTIFSTIGIDLKTKFMKVKDSTVKVLIWDTAGQEKFQNIAKNYYKGANGVLLVYDISNRKSFERVGFWLKELKENNKLDDLYLYLVGNKKDLEEKRMISTDEGKKFAEDNNIHFIEVSAKTGEGVREVFNNVLNGALDKIKKDTEKDDGEEKVRLSSFRKIEKKEKNNMCC